MSDEEERALEEQYRKASMAPSAPAPADCPGCRGIEELGQPPQRPREMCGYGVAESIYFRQPSEAPLHHEDRFFHSIENQQPEQVYGPRKFRVYREWRPLNCGWLSQPSLIVLSNKETSQWRYIPTEEESKRVMSRVFEVAWKSAVEAGRGSEECYLVHPKCSTRFTPRQADGLMIRCPTAPDEGALAYLLAFPGETNG